MGDLDLPFERGPGQMLPGEHRHHAGGVVVMAAVIDAPGPGPMPGFKALPAGNGGTPSHMTRTEAQTLLYRISGCDVYKAPEVAWRRARAAAHPDRNGGDRTTWNQVEQAARVLGIGAS